MISFSGRGILLDIEGTTSSVSYVYDVMFPFARRGLERYLREHWGSSELVAACERLAADWKSSSFAQWRGGDDDASAILRVRDEVLRMMDGDVKATGLKELQGLIWEAGFRSGELRAQVYADVPPALRGWREAGLDVRIYSSGSVHAQQLFFGHSEHGDLLPLLCGHYDTTTGPKREVESYRKIAAAFGLRADQILFLSDIPAELDAARLAGMLTALCLRPGNAPVAAGHGHAEITDFSQISLAVK